MEQSQNVRAFTRADVEDFFLKTFNDQAEIIYSVESVALLPEMTPISWVVYYVFAWQGQSGKQSFRNSAVVSQRNNAKGELRLWLAAETKLPESLPTPADEDAAIEQRKAEQYAEWLRRQEEQSKPS